MILIVCGGYWVVCVCDWLIDVVELFGELELWFVSEEWVVLVCFEVFDDVWDVEVLNVMLFEYD